jgi:hypothetical protein
MPAHVCETSVAPPSPTWGACYSGACYSTRPTNEYPLSHRPGPSHASPRVVLTVSTRVPTAAPAPTAVRIRCVRPLPAWVRDGPPLPPPLPQYRIRSSYCPHRTACACRARSAGHPSPCGLEPTASALALFRERELRRPAIGGGVGNAAAAPRSGSSSAGQNLWNRRGRAAIVRRGGKERGL